MAKSEEWKAQYDAVNRLRVLSKFHTAFLQKHLSESEGTFIAG